MVYKKLSCEVIDNGVLMQPFLDDFGHIPETTNTIDMSTAVASHENDTYYDFSSPLWDQYFKRTRENVRFPRNYKDISALDCDGCDCL
jgi:hypothetical protein